ncbi:MAG TPA: IS21 family transposase, partial [Anaerolineales bacterium]
MDLHEMLRLLRRGYSNRRIAKALRLNRKTVDKYRAALEQTGALEGELPEMAELEQILEAHFPTHTPPQNQSSVEPYRKRVEKLHDQGVEIAAIRQRLIEEYKYPGSYASVWRFVRQLETKTPEVTVRVEVGAGEEAQVDFGSAGKLRDPRTGQLRQAWVFVMTLSFSRHQYVEFVFDQKVETWLRCHIRAFAFFGGVPERVVIDNLKAAITKACWENPQVQRAYRECAAHYGFLIAPCQVATPQHKGKVEQGGVHYVKRNFLAGREPDSLAELNRDGRRWTLEVAGQRIHGTTRKKPLEQFEQLEKAQLQP